MVTMIVVIKIFVIIAQTKETPDMVKHGVRQRTYHA
jgi:hypothetical protein